MERRKEYIDLGAELAQLRGAFEEHKVSHRQTMEKLELVSRAQYENREHLKEYISKCFSPVNTQLSDHEVRLVKAESSVSIGRWVLGALIVAYFSVAVADWVEDDRKIMIQSTQHKEAKHEMVSR